MRARPSGHRRQRRGLTERISPKFVAGALAHRFHYMFVVRTFVRMFRPPPCRPFSCMYPFFSRIPFFGDPFLTRFDDDGDSPLDASPCVPYIVDFFLRRTDF